MEIKFSEFKGVHDDLDGIPLHRIRYYKINEQIVWDREKKIDLLSGHDMSEYFHEPITPKFKDESTENEPQNSEIPSERQVITAHFVEEFNTKINCWHETLTEESSSECDTTNCFKIENSILQFDEHREHGEDN
jgi:hypothetical protein